MRDLFLQCLPNVDDYTPDIISDDVHVLVTHQYTNNEIGQERVQVAIRNLQDADKFMLGPVNDWFPEAAWRGAALPTHLVVFKEMFFKDPYKPLRLTPEVIGELRNLVSYWTRLSSTVTLWEFFDAHEGQWLIVCPW